MAYRKDPLPSLLMLLGLVNLANSLLATWNNVEKSGWTPAYINTHWITSIIIFTAWAHYSMISGDYFSEVCPPFPLPDPLFRSSPS